MFKLLTFDHMTQLWKERVQDVESHLFKLLLNRVMHAPMVQANPTNEGVIKANDENEMQIAATQVQLQALHEAEPRLVTPEAATVTPGSESVEPNSVKATAQVSFSPDPSLDADKETAVTDPQPAS